MLNVRVISFADLTSADCARWDEWQAAQTTLDSPYFCREFIAAFAIHVSPVEVVIVENDGEPVAYFPYQRSRWNIAQPVGGALSDFHGIIGKPSRQFDLLRILAAAGLTAWDYQSVPVEQAQGETAALLHHAHYLELTAGFAAYCQARKKAGSETVEKTQRKERALARQHCVRFELQNNDPRLLQQLIQWKQRQNVELGVVTPLGCSGTATVLKHFLETRAEQLSARLSVLWIGDKPAAVSYSLVMPRTAHCWFLGFDENFSRSSPGLILLLKLAEALAAEGIQRLHLGKGNERFKTSLATGHLFLMEGVIGNWSPTLLLLQGWQRAKQRVKRSPLSAAIRLLRPVREWFTHGGK